MFIWPSSVSMISNSIGRGSYILWATLTVFILFVIGNLTEYKWTIKGLDYIGENSMVMYVSHAVVIVVVLRINDMIVNPMPNVILGEVMAAGILCLSILLLACKKKTPLLYGLK